MHNILNNMNNLQILEERLKKIIPENDIKHLSLSEDNLIIITKYENRLTFFANGKVICSDFYPYNSNQLDVGKCRFLLDILKIDMNPEFKGVGIINWNKKEKSGYWIIDENDINCTMIEYHSI